jgi:hypothetical protein
VGVIACQVINKLIDLGCNVTLLGGFWENLKAVDRGEGLCGGGSFCDRPSGPQQYFLTKLPTEIQFLGSRPAEIHVSVRYVPSLYCATTVAQLWAT